MGPTQTSEFKARNGFLQADIPGPLLATRTIFGNQKWSARTTFRPDQFSRDPPPPPPPPHRLFREYIQRDQNVRCVLQSISCRINSCRWPVCRSSSSMQWASGVKCKGRAGHACPQQGDMGERCKHGGLGRSLLLKSQNIHVA